MKKRKTTISGGITVLLFVLFQHATAQVKIPPAFFGHNLWNTDYTGAPFTGSAIATFSPSEWDAIKETGGKTMRVGGIGFTARRDPPSVPEFPRTEEVVGSATLDIPNSAGYVKIVDDCRANGFEPIITVPFNDRNKLRSVEEQALEAADIVRTVNLIHKRNVRFWIIANEPQQTQGYTGTFDNVMMVRKYVMAFAQEMKNVDPDILIIAPEMEFANATYFNHLFSTSTASTSIVGTIPGSGPGAGKYYVDYLSYHSYGGFGDVFTQTTTSPSRRKRYVDAAWGLKDSYNATYTTYVQPVNASRSTPMKLVINEFNMHDNTSSSLTSSLQTQTVTSNVSANTIASDDYSGNTFLAGQFIVDQMAAMLSVADGSGNCVYEFSNIWSVGEGMNYGMIHNNTDKKPTYWHYWLMSRYFGGTFFRNTAADPGGTSVDRCHRAYACRTENYIAVLVINQTQTGNSGDNLTHATGNKSFTIRFDNGSADFKFNMGGTATAYNGTIAPSSTSMLFFNCDGSTYLGRYDLTPAWVAANLTATTLPSSGTIPGLPSIGLSGSSCKTSGNTVTLTTTSNADWYESSDPNTPVLSASTTFTANAGMYYASTSGSCSGQPRSLVAVVNDVTPIISRNQAFAQKCSGGAAQLISVESGSQTYSWSPGTGTITSTTESFWANPAS